MKLQEAIETIEKIIPANKYDTSMIIKFISDLDRMVTDNILRKHENTKNAVFDGYDDNSDGDCELLVPAPYDDIYFHWVRTKIDLLNQDYERYNSSASAFYTQYHNYAQKFNRENKPITTVINI